MNKYYKLAEKGVVRVIKDLNRLLPQDGEDISYYDPSILDQPIMSLIWVRSIMARADECIRIEREEK